MSTLSSRKIPTDATPDTDSPSELQKRPYRPFKRLHQNRCGCGPLGYDSYADVLQACERKLAEWERQGVLAPYRPLRPNDWLFTASEGSEP